MDEPVDNGSWKDRHLMISHMKVESKSVEIVVDNRILVTKGSKGGTGEILVKSYTFLVR
jgi:hypothetical protein